MTHDVSPVSVPRARIAVGLMFFLNGTAFANWLARIPSVRETLHMSERTLGLVLFGTAVGALLAFRVASRLIARFSSRRVTWAAASAFCCLLPWPGVAPSAAATFAALCVLGMANGLMDVSMNSQAVEVERLMGRPVLSQFHGLFSMGGLVGASTGALAASYKVPPVWHLLGVACAMLLLAQVAAPGLVEDRRLAHHAPQLVRPSRRLLWLGLLVFCGSVGEGAMADWTGVYLRTVLHTSLGVAGLGFATYSFAMLTGRFVGDKITARLGAVRVVRLGGIAVMLGLGGGLLSNSLVLMLLGLLLTGFGLSAVVPVVFRAGGSLPNVAPGAALATLATLSYGAFLLGPPGIGFVAEHLTLRGGLAVVVALAGVLSVLAPHVESTA